MQRKSDMLNLYQCSGTQCTNVNSLFGSNVFLWHMHFCAFQNTQKMDGCEPGLNFESEKPGTKWSGDFVNVCKTLFCGRQSLYANRWLRIVISSFFPQQSRLGNSSSVATKGISI